MTGKMAPRISLIYGFVGVLWIGGSSLVVWADTHTGPVVAEVAKGMAFVVATATLIYLLIRRGERELERRNTRITEIHGLLMGVLDGSQDLIAAWGPDKRITALNRKFREDCEGLFGSRPEIGASLSDICPDDLDKRAEFDFILDRMLAGERFVEIIRIDGGNGTRWYEASLAPLMQGGEIVGGFLISRDTTARILVENTLRSREHWLQTIIDNLADYVTILGPDLTVRYQSAGFARATGFEPTDTLGKHKNSFIHPDDAPLVLAAIAEGISGGLPVRNLEYRCRHRDGQWHHHLLNGARSDDSDNPGFLAIVQVIDQRKDAESRLAHSAKLATVGQFAAGLTHELAHPVAVIRLAAEAALDPSLERTPGDEFFHEQMELVADQAKRMAALIENVRVISGKREARSIPFSPQTVLHAIVRMIHKQLDIDGIGLTTDICPSLATIIGDPFRLEQVMLNLIANARSAVNARRLAEGPAFRGDILLSCHCGPETIEIKVGDNGNGIAQVDLNRIFEPFFTTNRDSEGLGLGLSISLTIVKSFGGDITFVSIPGETVFRLVLPNAISLPVPPECLATTATFG